jgi:hypothetical protein
MTCRGYDPKAVKIKKSVKCLAASILDDHTRGQFIRDYVKIEQTRLRSSKKKSD